MRKLLSLALIMAIITGLCCTTSVVADETEKTTSLQDVRDQYDLYWNDEFDEDSIDMTKWKYEGSSAHRNGEAQVYADNDEDHNAWTEDGNLVIEARREDRIGYVSGTEKTYNYTSACMRTDTKMDFTYGIAEARLKIPASKCCWPAFWSCGYDSAIGKADWPRTGEIDIMENFGGSNSTTGSTLHYQPKGYTGTSKTATGGGGYSSPTMSTEFHTYGLYWTPEFISFFVDDFIIGTVDITDRDKFFAFHDFGQFFLLNIALGGVGGGTIPADFVSDKMYVDYVRVYKPSDGVYDQFTKYEAETSTDYSATTSCVAGTASFALGGATLNTYGRFTLPSFKSGTYDVFVQNKGNANASTYTVNMNGIDVGELPVTNVENRGQDYVGTIKVETDTDLNIAFTVTKIGASTSTNTLGVNIDNLMFVSTENEIATNIPYMNIVNREPKTVEVSSFSDWLTKRLLVFENDTIKLTGDITYEVQSGADFWQPTNDNITIDMNGHTISDGYYEAIRDAGSVNALDYSTYNKSRIFNVPAGYTFTVKDTSDTKGAMLSCNSIIADQPNGAILTVGTSSGAISTVNFSDVTLLNLARDTNGRTAVVRLQNANSNFTNCNFYTTYFYGYEGNVADRGLLIMTSSLETTTNVTNCRFVTNSSSVIVMGANKIVNLNNIYIKNSKGTGVEVAATTSSVTANNISANLGSSSTAFKLNKADSQLVVNNKDDSFTIDSDTYTSKVVAKSYGAYCSAGTITIDKCDILAPYGIYALTTGNVVVNDGKILTSNTTAPSTASSRVYAPIWVTDTATLTVNGGEFGCVENGNNQAVIYAPSATASVVLNGGKFTSATQFLISSTANATGSNPVTGKAYYNMDNKAIVTFGIAKNAFEDEQLSNKISQDIAYYTTIYVGKDGTALFGDVNNDGEISLADALLLAKYIAKWNVTVEQLLADTNGDSLINVKDLLYVKKYLSKI